VTLLDRVMGRFGWVPRAQLDSADALISRQKRDLDEIRKPWVHIVRVSDELVEQLMAEWSEPLQVRIATRKQGFYADELELVFRSVDRPIVVTTDYSRGIPCS
jgi:hypothetical protein